MIRCFHQILWTPIFLSHFLNNACAQSLPDYPQGYFRNPLNIPILLAGNFGECRPNHFHSGIDIKTNGRENLPVMAAAEGFVARIKIEAGGFGHALYIQHPNGYTTVYAHLNEFAPTIQAYLRQQQYEQEQWAVDLLTPPTLFPVRQGDLIAWSGNTGASTAPHLHFEVRDTQTEHPLNPQLFGLPVNDSRPPVPSSLALYDMSQSIYEQNPRFFPVQKTNIGFQVRDTMRLAGSKAGISLDIKDYMDGSENFLNVLSLTWILDGDTLGHILLDNIGYDKTRYLHAYADYQTYARQQKWYQCLFRLPGNQLPAVYQKLRQQGLILLPDDQVHTLSIVATDAAGNQTTIKAWLRSMQTRTPSTDCEHLFLPDRPNAYVAPNLRLSIPAYALYDRFCFKAVTDRAPDSALSSLYQVHQTEVPVHMPFTLAIKPESPVPFLLRDKMVLRARSGKSLTGRAARQADEGWYQADVRQFGTYWLEADTLAPIATVLARPLARLEGQKQLLIRVQERQTNVRSFRATLNEKWVLFEPSNGVWRYVFDRRTQKGRNDLILTVADENDNTSVVKYSFYR